MGAGEEKSLPTMHKSLGLFALDLQILILNRPHHDFGYLLYCRRQQLMSPEEQQKIFQIQIQ